MCGPQFFIGLFSDQFGRRPAFIASVIIPTLKIPERYTALNQPQRCNGRDERLTQVVLSAIFGAATVLVPNYEWMLVSRFVAGCAFGGNFPIAVSLITELVPTSHRSQCLILLQFFMELGAMIAAVAAWAVMPNWRLFILLSTTPACVAALFVVWIPESPSFLFAMGRTEEGSEVLRRIISFNSPPQSPKLAAKVEARDEAISKIVVPSKQEERMEHVISMANPETSDQNSSKWLIMLDPELRLALVAVLIAWFAAQIGSGWYVTQPCIHPAPMCSEPGCVFCCRYIWVVDIADRLDLKHISYVLMIVARLVVIVSFSLVTLVVDKVKPCQMLIGFLFGTAISALVFGYIIASGPDSWSFSAAFLAYVWFFAGAWPLLYVVSPKCFPTSVRVTCVALASGMSKVGSIVQPQIFGHMLDSSLFGIGIVVTCGWILAMAGVLVIFLRDKYYD